jgi:Tfp pilus assembly protein PilZ
VTSHPRTAVSFSPRTTHEWRTGELLEVEDGGLFVASNTLYPPGTMLSVVLTLPGERMPVQVSGQVSWARTREQAGMFIAFAEAPAERPDRERLLLARAGKARPAKKLPASES